jgi:hypothetical protein
MTLANNDPVGGTNPRNVNDRGCRVPHDPVEVPAAAGARVSLACMGEDPGNLRRFRQERGHPRALGERTSRARLDEVQRRVGRCPSVTSSGSTRHVRQPLAPTA